MSMDRVRSLHQAYQASLSIKAETCNQLWLAGESQRDNLLRFLHRLAGSAGMYGYPDITQLAIDFKILLESSAPDDKCRQLQHALYSELIKSSMTDSDTT